MTVFQDPHKVLNYFYKILGLSNFFIENNKRKRLPTIVIRSSLPITSIIIHIYTMCAFATSKSKTALFVNYLTFTNEICISLAILIFSNRKNVQLSTIKKQMDECNTELKEVHSENVHANCFRKTIIVMYINIIAVLLFIVYTSAFILNTLQLGSAAMNLIVMIHPAFQLMALSVTLNSMILYTTRVRYNTEKTGEYICRLIESRDDNIGDLNVAKSVYSLGIKLHAITIGLYNFFGVHFMIAICFNVVQMLWSMYNLSIDSTKMTPMIFFYNLAWICYHFYYINQWTFSINSLKREIAQLNNYFYKLNLAFPNSVFYNKITSLQILYNNYKLPERLYDFFPTDRTYNVWILSTTASFLVTLLQFTMAEEN